MVDPFVAHNLSASRLGDRLIRAPDGRFFLLSNDRKRGIWMWPDEMHRIGSAIGDAAEPTARMLRRSVWLNFPFVFAIFGISFHLGIEDDIDAMGQVFAVAFTLATLVGLPLFALFRHGCAMRSIMKQVEERLAARDWIDAPLHKARRVPDRTETVVLMLVAPNLIGSLLCWIDPAMLNNTPLTRSSLSWVTIAALSILLVRRLGGWSGRRLAAEPEEPASDAAADVPTGRRRRVLASQQGPC